MNDFKKRIEKLEKMQPKGFSALSDEELDRQIARMNTDPEVQQMYNDPNDPLHARAVALLKIIEEYTTHD